MPLDCETRKKQGYNVSGTELPIARQSSDFVSDFFTFVGAQSRVINPRKMIIVLNSNNFIASDYDWAQTMLSVKKREESAQSFDVIPISQVAVLLGLPVPQPGDL